MENIISRKVTYRLFIVLYTVFLLLQLHEEQNKNFNLRISMKLITYILWQILNNFQLDKVKKYFLFPLASDRWKPSYLCLWTFWHVCDQYMSLWLNSAMFRAASFSELQWSRGALVWRLETFGKPSNPADEQPPFFFFLVTHFFFPSREVSSADKLFQASPKSLRIYFDLAS